MVASTRPSEQEVRLFTDRISRSLAERPVDLEPRAHREKVADLLRASGEATHYEILGIELVATALEIHTGFERTARLLHPKNAARLDLAGREAVLEVLFERAVEAYLLLSHPETRKAYDRDLSPQARAVLVAAIKPLGNAGRDLARSYFERAEALADAEDYHFALELLQQAVGADPRGEYFALLGRIQAKNPQWLHEAEKNLRRALEMGTADRGLAAALEEVQQRLASGEAEKPVRHTADDDEVEIALPGAGDDEPRPRQKGRRRAPRAKR
jgi:curved DNA-binding protein CbpA